MNSEVLPHRRTERGEPFLAVSRSRAGGQTGDPPRHLVALIPQFPGQFPGDPADLTGSE